VREGGGEVRGAREGGEGGERDRIKGRWSGRVLVHKRGEGLAGREGRGGEGRRIRGEKASGRK